MTYGSCTWLTVGYKTDHFLPLASHWLDNSLSGRVYLVLNWVYLGFNLAHQGYLVLSLLYLVYLGFNLQLWVI